MSEWDAIAISGSLAAQYARDAREFLPLIAVFLEGTLPEQTQVVRAGGLFHKRKTVRSVTVDCGDLTYRLEDGGRGLPTATRIKTVRGIRLKTETLPMDQWLSALSEEIEAEARSNSESAAALQSLLDL